MNKLQIFKNTIFWGFILWFIGWVLGIIAFMAVPENMIGWVVSPIGIIITLWVLFKKIKRENFTCYIGLGVIWTIIAIFFDYIFIVKLFHSTNYYKPDVYFYYITTLVLPIIVGLIEKKSKT